MDGHIEVMLEMVCRGLPEQSSDSQGNAGGIDSLGVVLLVVSNAGDDSHSGNLCDIRVVIGNRWFRIQHGACHQTIASPSFAKS